MPWANGGGSTRQVAIDPPDGSLQRGFRWRVSCAHVASDGPFSRLPGIDRSLWLVRGSGMRLRFADREVVLRELMQRADFAGEDEVRAELLGGPCEDCNVMTRRGVVAAHSMVERLSDGERRNLEPAQQRLLLILAGSVSVADGCQVAAVQLSAGDAAQLDAQASHTLIAHAPSTVLSVSLEALD